MFEKFPQLWRLERLLSKAQTENVSDKESTLNFLLLWQGFSFSTSPTLGMKKGRDFCRRKIKHDVLDDIAEAFEQQARIQNRALNLYDSDDLTGFKKPQPYDDRETKRGTDSKKQDITITTNTTISSTIQEIHSNISSPKNKKCFTLTQREHTMKSSISAIAGHEVFLRQMEDFKPSDAMSVLSDEETEDSSMECHRLCRYPLPTMPLAIMIPATVTHLPLAPLNRDFVSESIAQFDDNIKAMKQIRHRLSSCFELFDDLCTSFCGPQNLDCFLRSMLSSNSFRKSPWHKHDGDGALIQSRTVGKRPTKELFSSVPPETLKRNDDQKFCRSRLLRPTISTQMKHVDARNKEYMSGTSDLSTTPPTIGNKKQLAADKMNSKTTRCIPVSAKLKPSRRYGHKVPQVPQSDQDAREDMLLRVRRQLMRMPWMGRSRRKSAVATSLY